MLSSISSVDIGAIIGRAKRQSERPLASPPAGSGHKRPGKSPYKPALVAFLSAAISSASPPRNRSRKPRTACPKLSRERPARIRPADDRSQHRRCAPGSRRAANLRDQAERAGGRGPSAAGAAGAPPPFSASADFLGDQLFAGAALGGASRSGRSHSVRAARLARRLAKAFDTFASQQVRPCVRPARALAERPDAVGHASLAPRRPGIGAGRLALGLPLLDSRNRSLGARSSAQPTRRGRAGTDEFQIRTAIGNFPRRPGLGQQSARATGRNCRGRSRTGRAPGRELED